MFCMTRVLGVLLAVCAVSAADLPLGTVVQVADSRVELSFDTAASILPDDMVAIYGPGSVTKHPLTGEVTVEQRKLVAKVHVLAVSGGRLSGRVTWQEEGATIASGYDAVPLPGEASPDAPPVLTGTIEALSVEPQGTVTLRLPVADPEGGELSVVWSTSGAGGQLEARTTVEPEVRWSAPGFSGEVTVSASVRDPRGQSLDVSIPITVGELAADWRKRELVTFANRGGRDATQWQHLHRAWDGWWIAIARDGQVHRIAPGWGHFHKHALQEDARVDVVATVPRREGVWLLDRRSRSVLLLGRDGVIRTQIGNLEEGTDLAVDDQGAIYVADQRQGGVVVYEAKGPFRLRIGRPGEGDDAFARLTRIDIGPANELYALDSEGFRIHRYDRFHRRQEAWEIQGDREIRPIDLVHHSLGLLVLMSSGQVLVYNEVGLATTAMQSPLESGWFEQLREPASIEVDGSGDIFVTYPDEGLVVRYNAQGIISGVRGTSLWQQDHFVVDAAGNTYGLDRRSGRITRYDSEGWMLGRFAGTERFGGPFSEPGSMAISHDGDHLFVIDSDRVNIMRFDLSNPQDQPFVFGQRGSNPGQFEEPIALAIDGDKRCYVLDADLHRVAVFDADGSFLFNFGYYERGKQSDELIDPKLLAVAEDGFTAYVYDARRYEIMKFDLDQSARTGTHISNAGGRGKELGQFAGPVGMACDRVGLLYVLDGRRYDLQAIDFSGTNAVTLHAAALPDMGLRRPEALSLGPDGVPWVKGDERLLGLRWKR